MLKVSVGILIIFLIQVWNAESSGGPKDKEELDSSGTSKDGGNGDSTRNIKLEIIKTAITSGKFNDAQKEQLLLTDRLYGELEDIKSTRDVDMIVIRLKTFCDLAIRNFMQDEDFDEFILRMKNLNERVLEILSQPYSRSTIRTAIKTGKFDENKRAQLELADKLIGEISHPGKRSVLLNDVDNVINAFYYDGKSDEFSSRIEAFNKKASRMKIAYDIELAVEQLRSNTRDSNVIEAADRTASLILSLEDENYKYELTKQFLKAMEEPNTDKCKKRIENIGKVTALDHDNIELITIKYAITTGKFDDAEIEQLMVADGIYGELKDIKYTHVAIQNFYIENDDEQFRADMKKLNERVLDTLSKTYSHSTIQNAVKTGKFDKNKRAQLRQADKLIGEINHQENQTRLINEVADAISAFSVNKNSDEFNLKMVAINDIASKVRKMELDGTFYPEFINENMGTSSSSPTDEHEDTAKTGE